MPRRRFMAAGSMPAQRTTGLRDVTVQRDEEARRAISWAEGSHGNRTTGRTGCRRRDRWSLYLADLGVFLGGVAVLLPEGTREHIVEVVGHIL